MIEFNFKGKITTAFGVGYGDRHAPRFVKVPVDCDVQNALIDMAKETVRHLLSVRDSGEPTSYQPSEKYGTDVYLVVPKDNNLGAPIRKLHEAKNLSIDADVMKNPAEIFWYFAQFVNKQGERLTALRRASYFKGTLGKKLICLLDDTFKFSVDKVFRLDKDFDMLVYSENIHISRPNAFEAFANVKEAVLKAVPDNIAAIKKHLSFMDFEEIQTYAAKHSRAARSLASIRDQNLHGITCERLKKECGLLGVNLTEVNGLLKVANKDIPSFLNILDHRIYRENLTPDSKKYKAMNRHKIN